MRYRAILNDPGDTTAERPREILGMFRPEMERWAKEVLKQAVSPDASVSIYQSVETEVALILKHNLKSETDKP